MRTMANVFASLILFIALIFVITSCGRDVAQNAGYSWPRWRGPNGDGISKETGWDPMALARGAKILWNVNVGNGYSNIAIQNSRIYTLGVLLDEAQVAFQCLHAGTGKVIWRHLVPEDFMSPQSTPAIDGDRVYGLTYDGILLCLRAANGKVLWKKNLEGDFKAKPNQHGWALSPVVVGNLLLLNANSTGIALDKKTGDLVWSVADSKPSATYGSFASTVVGGPMDSKIALFLGPGTLSGVEVRSGKTLWSYLHGTPSHPVADPIAYENKVFLQLDEWCTLLEIGGTGPKVLWQNPSLCGALPTPVLVNGYLYGTNCPPEDIGQWDSWGVMSRFAMPFRCVDWTTGKVVWEKTMKSSTLMAADGKLIILELNGMLHIVEATPSSYRELSQADVFAGQNKPRAFATPPVLCNGRIYCRNYAGDLICIDVSK